MKSRENIEKLRLSRYGSDPAAFTKARIKVETE